VPLLGIFLGHQVYAAKSTEGWWRGETHEPDRKCDGDADNEGVEHGLLRIEVEL